MAVEEALKQRFNDSKGKLTKYKKKDLDYDIGKWLIVDIEGGDSHACGEAWSEASLHCTAMQLLAAERPYMIAGMLVTASSIDDTAKGAPPQYFIILCARTACCMLRTTATQDGRGRCRDGPRIRECS